jgi:3-phosphoshikimate 1-carboxyvinyltransferase
MLAATQVDAAEIPSLDEVPALAVAATAARGTTTFFHVGELRVKESDRFAATVRLVEALGGRATEEGDDLVVEGTGALGPGPVRFDSGGDHRLAMAAVAGALGCPTGGVIGGFECVSTSYPAFLEDLETLAGTGAWEAVAAGR